MLYVICTMIVTGALAVEFVNATDKDLAYMKASYYGCALLALAYILAR